MAIVPISITILAVITVIGALYSTITGKDIEI